jgi:hypothetical protein
MRKTVLAAALVLIVAAAASAGDVKILLIKQYNDPNWRGGGNTRFSDAQVAELEQELSGNQGGTALGYANCTYLNYLYTMLQNTDYRKIVDRIAAMSAPTLYIYLVDDKDGLTQIMQDYAGVCDYPEADGKRYAWLCGHSTPERAVKIGEHYAKAFFDAFSKEVGTKEAFSALAAAFLGEMMHSVTQTPAGWYPNDLILKTSEVQTRLSPSARKLPATNFRKRVTSSRPEDGASLTLMPNFKGSGLRAMEIFVSACWSRSLLNVYEKIFQLDGFFRVEKGTDTYSNIGVPQESVVGNYVYYLYTDYYLNKDHLDDSRFLKALTENELFAGLTLYYLGAYWPHEIDAAGKAAYGFELVMDAYNAVKDTDPAVEPGLLFNIISTMFKRIPAYNNVQEIRERRLFLIALIDYLSDYKGDRNDLNYHLEQYVIPTTELQPLLNYYFGGGQAGIRNMFETATLKEDTTIGAVKVFADYYNRVSYVPVWK